MVKGYRVTASHNAEVMFARFADNSLASTEMRSVHEEFNPEGTVWYKAHRLPMGAVYLGEFSDPMVTQTDAP